MVRACLNECCCRQRVTPALDFRRLPSPTADTCVSFVYRVHIGIASVTERLLEPRNTTTKDRRDSCSASTLRDVPPPLPREAPVRAPTLAHCAWPSLRHDQLGAPNHLSADNLTRLARRSLLVAARRFAPCRHAQALDTRSRLSVLTLPVGSASRRFGAYRGGTLTRGVDAA